MDTDEEFCLKWNNHHSIFLSTLSRHLENELLVDVTLAAEGKFIEAHRLVLSTCSDYFQDALRIHENKYANKHAFIFLNNVIYDDLKALVDYMYKGEVNVSQEQLPRFLATAEALRIKGLSDKGEQPQENVELDNEHLPNSQTRTKNVSRKAYKSASRSTAITSSLPTSRQTRISQQIITPNHFIAPQPQVSGSSPQNSRNSTELVPEAEVITPEVNFVSVNANGDEIDLDQNEEDGLGTLSKVWSMNQDDDGGWRNAVGILDDNKAESSAAQEEEESYVTPSESDNSIEYRHYVEPPPNVNLELVEDAPLNPTLSAQTKSKWASSLSATGTPYSVSTIRGRPSGSSSNNADCQEGVSKVTCPNCGRGYSQKGSLNRHIKFECGIIPKFPCQLCPMRFRRAYKLTEHHNRIHSGSSVNLNV